MPRALADSDKLTIRVGGGFAEENTLWGQQQQQRQSFPELKGDGNTISRVLVGNSSGAATLRKGPHSAKENTENCGGGREGQGTPPSARIHDNNKSNVSR